MPLHLKQWVTKGRVIACLVLLVGGGFWWYRSATKVSAESKYVLSAATKGMLIISLSGTGQVSSESQLDVKPLVSGKVLDIPVKEGQEVKKGDILMKLDQSDALKSVRDAGQTVRDAQVSLASARLSFSKIKQPPQATSLLQATNAVNQAQRDLDALYEGPNASDLAQAQAQIQSAQQNVKPSADGKTPQVIRNAYDNEVAAFKAILPTLTTSLNDADIVLAVDNAGANASFATLLSVLDQSRKYQAIANYSIAKGAIQSAKTAIDPLVLQNEDPKKIDGVGAILQDALEKTAVMLNDVSMALSSTLTSSSFSQSSLDSLKNTIQSDRTNITSKQSTLVTQQQSVIQANTSYTSSLISLEQAKISLDRLNTPPDPKSVAAAEERLTVAKQQLVDLKAGALPIDVQIAQNSVDQRATAVTAAQIKYSDIVQTLANYTVVAPFDGIVAKILVQKTDSVSSGTAVVTMLTNQQLATITLNEVDAAKVKSGQKVTVSFDAVDGLTMTGTIANVSALGTVTQGIVNYTTKIVFDTQDPRIRAGMSVRASIVIDTRSDVVLVPNAAVKTSGGQQYVQFIDNMSPSGTSAGTQVSGTVRRQIVQIGATNDSETEIVSGVNEGDQVVVQTITAAASAAAPAASNSSIRIPGMTGGGAGGFGGGR